MKKIPIPKRVIKIKRKRRLRALRLIIIFLILFLSIFFALAFFSFTPKMTINKVVVTGNNIINSQDVISLVRKEINGKYYGLFSKADIFIYPHNEIYKNLLLTFPRIKKVSITRKNFNTLYININEKSASYLYCGSVIPDIKSKVGENCYFMNNDGYIFSKAPYFSGNVYFKYYLKVKNRDKLLGQTIIEPEYFHNLVRFIDGIKALGLKPVSLVIIDDGTNYLYLGHNLNETTPKIIFMKTNNLKNILSNLSIAMNKALFADEINSKYSTLLYIDLRFKNKVLYKFK